MTNSHYRVLFLLVFVAFVLSIIFAIIVATKNAMPLVLLNCTTTILLIWWMADILKKLKNGKLAEEDLARD